jgi:Tfp pilus assembly protein PilO
MKMKQGSKSKLPVLVIVLVLLALLALAGWQFMAYRTDKGILEAKLVELKAEHAKLAKMEEQKQETKAELGRKTRELENARKKLPAGVEIDAFKKRIKEYAIKSGYATASFEKKAYEEQEGSYYYIDQETEVLGRKGRADKFMKLLKADPRLTIVSHEGYMPVLGNIFITVRMFYMPADEYICASADLCEYPHQPSVWLPPLTGWIKEMENDRALTCESIKEMGDLSLDDCGLRNVKEELAGLMEVIKALEKK